MLAVFHILGHRSLSNNKGQMTVFSLSPFTVDLHTILFLFYTPFLKRCLKMQQLLGVLNTSQLTSLLFVMTDFIINVCGVLLNETGDRHMAILMISAEINNSNKIVPHGHKLKTGRY